MITSYAFLYMPFADRFITSLFAAVTPRTAGYNTVDLGAMTQASKLLTIILMFIGGCPGSTAGGVKTTSIVIIMVYIWSNLRNASGCNIYGRRLADEDIKKASMVIGLNLIMAVAALLIISGMQSFDFEDLCLEVFSAVILLIISLIFASIVLDDESLPIRCHPSYLPPSY